jgi:thioredoxin reductase (NADPH)
MLLSDLTIERVEEKPSCDAYDCVIIGGGPAGLTAGIYTARARLKTLILEEKAIGGEIVVADIVENYPGFPKGISGSDLTSAMEEQARSFGVEICETGARSISIEGDERTVNTTDDRKIKSKAVIIAAGTENVKLNVKGEKQFTGRGVSYCAQCDGAFFRDKEVIVIGGGDTAIGDAIFLSRFAKKLYIVHRRDKLRAEKILQERAFGISSIEFIWDSVVTEIMGTKTVESVDIKHVKTGVSAAKKINGVFIFIGTKPNTSFVKDIVTLDESGYIITTPEMETTQSGIFAAGDIRSKTVRQVSTAIGDGATAGAAVQRYIEALERIGK